LYKTILLTLALGLCPIAFGSGFVAPKGSLFFKLETQFQDASDFYTSTSGSDVLLNFPGVRNIEEVNTNLYIRLGLTDRFSVSLASQYQDAQIGTPDGGKLTNAGLSDVWIRAEYLLKQNRLSWVLNGGVKLPIAENEAVLPQLSTGELAYEIGLGLGYGAAAYYIEGELFYRFQSGTTESPVPAFTGIEYENEYGAIVKGGLKLTSRLNTEALLAYQDNQADLATQAGLFSNSDKLEARLTADFDIVRDKFSLGIFYGDLLGGKNALKFSGYGLHATYRIGSLF